MLFELVDTVSAAALRGLRRQPKGALQGGWHTASVKGEPGMRDYTHAVAYLHLRHPPGEGAANTPSYVGRKLRLQMYKANKGQKRSHHDADTREHGEQGGAPQSGRATKGRRLGWLSKLGLAQTAPASRTGTTATSGSPSRRSQGVASPPTLPGCPQAWRWFCDQTARDKLPLSLHVSLKPTDAHDARRMLDEESSEAESDAADDSTDMRSRSRRRASGMGLSKDKAAADATPPWPYVCLCN